MILLNRNYRKASLLKMNDGISESTQDIVKEEKMINSPSSVDLNGNVTSNGLKGYHLIIICSVLSTIIFAHSSILIHGTKKGKPCYLLCWMILFGWCMIAAALTVLSFYTIKFFSNEEEFALHDNDNEDRMKARLHEEYTANNKRMIAGVYMGVALVLMVVAYNLTVVNSYRLELLKSTETDHQENKVNSHNEVENKMYINNGIQKSGDSNPVFRECSLA